MGTCGQPGYVFWDLCLKQGNKFITFCLNQGIGLSIFYCPRKDILFKTGYLKQGRKISEIYLKQGQGMRGRAAPPNPRIYRVPPPPPEDLVTTVNNKILTYHYFGISSQMFVLIHLLMKFVRAMPCTRNPLLIQQFISMYRVWLTI